MKRHTSESLRLEHGELQQSPSAAVVGRSGRVATMTGSTDHTAADSVMTAWDADHLEGRELPPALANQKFVVL